MRCVTGRCAATLASVAICRPNSTSNLIVLNILIPVDKQVMNPHVIEVALEDVGGLEGVVAEMEEKVIAPLQHPEIYRTTLWRQTKGVLLYG